MKPILIVKLGSTIPALAESQGDFEDWIARGLGREPGQIEVADPRVAPLPDAARFSGVILTGSHSMVTDRETWSEQTARWIPAVLQTRTPVLGICYGHQLIAHALGGDVGVNPQGREFGTVEIVLHESARTDPLFTDLPDRFGAHASHTQSVLRLPPGAVCLASSDRDPHHAYRLGESTWCVQFHPEFDVAAVRSYIGQCADALRDQGDDPDRLRDAVAETPWAESLLKRFGEIAGASSGPC